MKNKKTRHIGILLGLTLAACAFVAAPQGAEAKSKTASSASAQNSVTAKNKWVLKNQNWYYYNSQGKRSTGWTKIGSRTYYFTAKGIQKLGWQKIGSQYYYFKNSAGKSGYMKKSTEQNGIKLKSNGRASMTSYAKKKMTVLIYASQIVENKTKPAMKRVDKLRVCFDYLVKNTGLHGDPVFHKTTNWDIDYALKIINDRHGACYAWAGAMAYFGNACGYPSAIVSSASDGGKGHGWAEINGYVSDPYWETQDSKHSYFLMKYSLSGVGGRPRYSSAKKGGCIKKI